MLSPKPAAVFGFGRAALARRPAVDESHETSKSEGANNKTMAAYGDDANPFADPSVQNASAASMDEYNPFDSRSAKVCGTEKERKKTQAFEQITPRRFPRPFSETLWLTLFLILSHTARTRLWPDAVACRAGGAARSIAFLVRTVVVRRRRLWRRRRLGRRLRERELARTKPAAS